MPLPKVSVQGQISEETRPPISEHTASCNRGLNKKQNRNRERKQESQFEI